MRKVKHNKIRNTGLLFEFLLRQITSDVLNKNNGQAVSIVKEKFNENTELGKELALYNIYSKPGKPVCTPKPVFCGLLCDCPNPIFAAISCLKDSTPLTPTGG